MNLSGTSILVVQTQLHIYTVRQKLENRDMSVGFVVCGNLSMLSRISGHECSCRGTYSWR